MLSQAIHSVKKLKNPAGFSLLEILIVVFIMGIMAAIVMPNFSSTDPAKLDLAASEVMQAIRMARQESIRTGDMHGLTISQDTQDITVKKYDLTTDPVSTDIVLTHPISKQPFDHNIESHSLTSRVVISNIQDAFLYSDSQRRKSLLFDRNGTPVWFFGATDSIFQLQDGTIQLSYAGQTRTIKVAPFTGRVTEQ